MGLTRNDPRKKTILLVVPVYNEEEILERSIARLVGYMSKNVAERWKILIADNASNDRTAEVSMALTRRYPNVGYVFLKQKGRGNALRHCWTKYDADIYAYCDADLATGISSMKRLFSGISEGYDIVIGNRYLARSRTRRSPIRLLLSKGYITLAKILFNTTITDFQCGFKAINRRVATDVIPMTKSAEWVFDTEFLLISERKRYRILQIPITWKEESGIGAGRKSKVKRLRAIMEHIGFLLELRGRLAHAGRAPSLGTG